MVKTSKTAIPSGSSKILVLILVIAGVALLLGFASGAFGKPKLDDFRNNLIDEDTTQAVHLSDGRVYFGDIGFRGDSVVINGAYYVDDADAAATKASLVKHGTEGYGPEGTIIVNSEQVLFWENLKDNSIVTQTISDNKKGDKN